MAPPYLGENRSSSASAQANVIDQETLDLLHLAPASVQELVDELDAVMVARAREDPAVFNAYVLRDEETGERVTMQPMHVEWHRLHSKHKRIVIFSHTEAAKTSSLTIGRVLWELGHNPQLRIIVLMNTAGQASQIIRTIARYIESSPELHKVFPHLRRDFSRPWNDGELNVERRTYAKDPSVRATGVHGNITGGRCDRLYVDDILDQENTLTPRARAKLKSWFRVTLEGRLTFHSKVCAVGNAWERDDIMHEWARSPDWFAVKYPVMNAKGESSWPARWPKERIEAQRRILGPSDFARQMMCEARNDEDSRFKMAWIQKCLENGEGINLTHRLLRVPPGFRTYTGVDLGVRATAGNDLTVLFTILIHPNEDREVLECVSGHWKGPEIVRRIFDVHARYHSIVMVENNAAQQFILDFARDKKALPIIPFTTGANKSNQDFGIESLATEFAAEKWIIPAVAGQPATKELSAWINDMLFYVPSAHTGDRLMASWFAREASRFQKPKGKRHNTNLMAR